MRHQLVRLCDTFVYYGLSLFITKLAGDRFVNFALSGVAELPAYFIAPPLLNMQVGQGRINHIAELFTTKDIVNPSQKRFTKGDCCCVSSHAQAFRFGRKWVVGGSHLLAGVSLLGLIFIPSGA